MFIPQFKRDRMQNYFMKKNKYKVKIWNRTNSRNHFICNQAKDFLKNLERRLTAVKINLNILLKL